MGQYHQEQDFRISITAEADHPSRLASMLRELADAVAGHHRVVVHESPHGGIWANVEITSRTERLRRDRDAAVTSVEYHARQLENDPGNQYHRDALEKATAHAEELNAQLDAMDPGPVEA